MDIELRLDDQYEVTVALYSGRREYGFRTMLSDVLDGGDVWKLTVEDCGKIAVRYREWFEPPLSSGWRTLACNSRSAQ